MVEGIRRIPAFIENNRHFGNNPAGADPCGETYRWDFIPDVVSSSKAVIPAIREKFYKIGRLFTRFYKNHYLRHRFCFMLFRNKI
jgi:hypothetical protein